ncbi:MAG TPA: M23 family metallopeptidase, partial [Candidatus Limnocylindrales bacterium]|nr:M23 family metallopeptidase [Candidatus Limnocylindrales bacterium]
LAVKYLHRRAVRIARRFVDYVTPIPTGPRSSGPQPASSRTGIGRESRPVATHRIAATRSSAWAGSGRSDGLRRFLPGLRRLDRRLLRARLSSERTLPIAIAFIVVLASVISLGPAAIRTVGAAETRPQDLRLAVGGGVADRISDDPILSGTLNRPTAARLGTYVDDGTLYKPVAVDTTVESGSSLLRHYNVRSGDTLTTIASRFGVSMMTLWWANNLTTKDSLKLGESLVIPPVSGLVVTVKATDTLDALAATYKVESTAILDLNGLTDPNLVVGQILTLPGAQGAPIPTVAPTPTPTPKPVSLSSTVGGTTRPPSYTGGAWAWPVVGGNNYVSQYFHYGHYGIDIAAQYGSPIVSPLAGTVIFAGWSNNGGGYEVWVSHGGGIYTAHNHMSGVNVSVGQSVARGQLVGRVGMSGWATGPHDHFEVWIGYPWKSSSVRVNPLHYY